MAYIVDNSESKVLITSRVNFAVAGAALARCLRVQRCLVVDGRDLAAARGDPRYVDYEEAVSPYPQAPLTGEWLGTAMLYSSGTTGRPKGILRPLPDDPPSKPLPTHRFLGGVYQCVENMVYLSPAPLYHAAPHVNVSMAIRSGGTGCRDGAIRP